MSQKQWTRWITLLCWILLIFLLSHQNGESSARLSETVKLFIKEILSFFHLAGDSSGQGKWGWIVRKIAHVTVYATLYILTFRVVILYKSRSVSIWLSMAFCLVYASTDEFHQTFISGRSGTIRDVGIDMIGVILALILLKVYLFNKTKNKLIPESME